jgi:hypothetical protein
VEKILITSAGGSALGGALGRTLGGSVGSAVVAYLSDLFKTIGGLIGFGASKSQILVGRSAGETSAVRLEVGSADSGLRVINLNSEALPALRGGEVITMGGRTLFVVPRAESMDRVAAFSWFQQQFQFMLTQMDTRLPLQLQIQLLEKATDDLRKAAQTSLLASETIAEFSRVSGRLKAKDLKDQLGREFSLSDEALERKVLDEMRRPFIACFVAGTLVHTQEGLRPIEQIQVGDYVLSKSETGEGELAYKRVVRTAKVEDAETWFVTWEDPQLRKDLAAKKITPQEFIDANGQNFVVTTPNHPFWVVDTDVEELDKCVRSEGVYFNGPHKPPQQEWVRADMLMSGMNVLLENGRTAVIAFSNPAYKSGQVGRAWAPNGDGRPGCLIDSSGNKVSPSIHLMHYALNEREWSSHQIDNPDRAFNEEFDGDFPYGTSRHMWNRSTVYNMEVEDFHTYFVEKMGVWVHNDNCFGTQPGVIVRVFNDIKEYNAYVKALPADQRVGINLRTVFAKR